MAALESRRIPDSDITTPDIIELSASNPRSGGGRLDNIGQRRASVYDSPDKMTLEATFESKVARL